MSEASQIYEIIATETFDKMFGKLEKDMKDRISKKISKLVENPYSVSETLTGNLKHFRKLRIGDIRLLFRICEECKTKGHTSISPCKVCSNEMNKHIILGNIDWRGKIYQG